MASFELIDEELYRFAGLKRAEISFTGSWYYGIPEDKITERRILWVEGTIGKGVIIQPNFTSNDINSPFWDFWNVAWLKDDKEYPRGVPMWKKYLLKRVVFSEIETKVGLLLAQSDENLKALKLEDLKTGRPITIHKKRINGDGDL